MQKLRRSRSADRNRTVQSLQPVSRHTTNTGTVARSLLFAFDASTVTRKKKNDSDEDVVEQPYIPRSGSMVAGKWQLSKRATDKKLWEGAFTEGWRVREKYAGQVLLERIGKSPIFGGDDPTFEPWRTGRAVSNPTLQWGVSGTVSDAADPVQSLQGLSSKGSIGRNADHSARLWYRT